jgi:hypothetical protein
VKRTPRKAKASAKGPAKARAPRLSQRLAPPDMSAEDWQRALRRQFGREQNFGLENVGEEVVFSEFTVRNPDAGTAYRVRIRGARPGGNACTCPDFLTNELGTCKHIEYVLARLETRRGAKAALKRGFHPPYSDLCVHYGSPRAMRWRPGSECPEAVIEAGGDLFVDGDGLDDWRLPPARLGELEGFRALCAQARHELRIDDAALDLVAGLRDAERRRTALAQAFPEGAASPALAALVKVPLYPYQAEGALFAVAAGRALIGDDMGLGKTIQAITAAEIYARHFGVSRVLVVCPTSLKHQWQREIARFAGRDARVIDGGRAQRRQDFAADDF